jgi:hypothetical protein
MQLAGVELTQSSLFVAESDSSNEVFGFYALGRMDDHQGELAMLFVGPAHIELGSDVR